MTSITPVKKTTAVMRNSVLTSTTNNTPAKSFLSPNRVTEVPLDSDARYTISYVPGMSEHEIETGKTFEEAKMKIVILSCELERVNTHNYTLVRENEVLRVQANKSEREKDLETKLAIVLAENEKLNQIIEEVYEVYMSTRGVGTNQEYQIRLTEMYQDLEEWKSKYNALEKSTNIVELQNQIRSLQHQNETLSEQLGRKDRDLEAMRGRISSLESSVVSNDSQYKIADYENKIRSVLADNEKLNSMLLSKANEVSELKAKLNIQNDSSVKLHEYSIQLNNQIDTHKKSAGIAQKETTERLQSLIGENEKLKQENAGLKSQVYGNRDTEAQLRILHEEIDRLNLILHEKDREIAALYGNNAQTNEQKAAIERLSLKIQELIQQNDSLNKLADAKSLETTGLYNKIRELESRSNQNEESVIRIRLVSEEKEKLREQLEQKNREIQDLYLRCSELNQSTLIVSEYKEKIVLLTQDNERLNNLVHAKLDESDVLKRKLASAEVNRVDAGSYEEKIHILLAENQRLTDLHRSQANEVDTLRASVYQLQSDLNHYGELGMKLALVSTENERLNREVETLKGKLSDDQSHSFKVQINYLNSEKQKLEALLGEKDREIWNLKNDHARVIETNVGEFHRESEKLKSAGMDQRRKIGELEGRISQLVGLETKVNYLSIEVEKLHQEVVERENHIQLISQKLGEKEREVADYKIRLQSADAQRVHEVEEIRSRIQIELESKFASIRMELEAQIRQLAAEKRDLEGRDILVKNLQAENEEWKRRYYQLQSSNDSEVEELRKQFEGLKAMTVQVKDMQSRFAAERTAYETQILQMSQMISDLEHQVQIISTENGRMTELSLQRLKMIEELKANSNEDAHRLEILELRNQLELLKSNSYDVKQLALQYSSEKATFKSKITELSQLIATYKEDITELSSLLEKRKGDVESLNKQNEELRKMCEKLNAQIRAGSSTSGIKEAGNIEVLQLKVAELEIAKSEFQRQAERNFVELSRKNKELVDKIQECDVLNLKYEEAVANLQALNNQAFTRLSIRK